METLEALAVRCESATAEQQYDVIGDAWDALGPTARWTAEQAGRFGKMMDAGAFESAALIMLPEGSTFYVDSGTNELSSGCHACVWSLVNRRMTGGSLANATPALALTAAALRAHLLAQKDHTPS